MQSSTGMPQLPTSTRLLNYLDLFSEWLVAIYPALLAIVFPVLSAAKEEAALIALCLYACAIILKKLFSQGLSYNSNKIWNSLLLSLVFFSLWMSVATAFSQTPSESFAFYIKYFLLIISGWACAIALRSPLFQRSCFFWLIALNACGWGGWAIFEYFLPRHVPQTWLDPSVYKLIPTRTTGNFIDPNLFGLYLGGLLPFLAGGYWANYEKGKLTRVFFSISFVLTGIGLMTTFSRGSGIAAVAGLIALLLIVRKRIWSHPGNKAGLVCIVILIATALFSPFRHRLFPPPTVKGDFAVVQRKAIFQGLNEARETLPIYGFGPDSFAKAYLKFRPFGGEYPLHAHNEFAQTWFETGIPGFSLLFLVTLISSIQFLKIFRHPDQNLSWQENAGLGLLITGFIQNMSGFSIRTMPTACLLAIGVGAFFNSFKINEEEGSQKKFSYFEKGIAAILALTFCFLNGREAIIQYWAKSANTLIERTRYAKAAKVGHQIVALSPGSFSGHFILGRSYRKLKQFNLAQKFLDSAIEINSTSADVWQEKARLAEDQGINSIVWWQKALKVDPCDCVISLLLARALKTSGKKEEAIKVIEEGLARCSPFPEIYKEESDILNDYLNDLRK